MNRNLTRWLMPALFALSTVLAAMPAHAAWSYDPVKWHRQNNATAYNGGVYGIPPCLCGQFDTTFVSAAASRVDTTGSWSMLDAEPSPLGSVSLGATTVDSTQTGAVVIAGDSTVASTFAWGATAIQLQVNYGSNAAGWTSYGPSISPLPTTTQKAAYFPILQYPVATAHLGSTTNYHTYGMFAPAMRAIVTWGAAAAVPSARVFVRKWIGTGVVQLPKSDRSVSP